MLVAIACMSNNVVLGIAGQMPWRQRSDMMHFKATTWGHRVIVGHTTFKNLNPTGDNEKGLPGRILYVATDKRIGTIDIDGDAPVIFMPMRRIIENFKDSRETIYVAGGAQVYTQLLPYCEKVVLSVLHMDVDTYGYPPSAVAKFPDDLLSANFTAVCKQNITQSRHEDCASMTIRTLMRNPKEPINVLQKTL